MSFFIKDTSAVDRGTHWFGGADCAVEIVSPGDRTLEKLAFYSKIGTRELLVIDRNPWQLTMYRLVNERLSPVAVSRTNHQAVISSEVIPIHLQFDSQVPCIRLTSQDSTSIRDIPIVFH